MGPGWQEKLCDPSLKRAIPERFRDEFLIIKCYTNLRLLHFIGRIFGPWKRATRPPKVLLWIKWRKGTNQLTHGHLKNGRQHGGRWKGSPLSPSKIKMSSFTHVGK